MARRVSQLDDRMQALIQAAVDDARNEPRRLMRRTYVGWSVSFAVLAAVIFTLLRFGDTLPLWSAPWFAFAAPATMALSAIVILWIWRDEGLRRYKSHFVRRVVEAIGEGATYSPEASFTAAELDALAIFPDRATRLRAEDQISGKRGNVAFRYLEILAPNVLRSGGVRWRRPRLFDGYLLVLEFSWHFRGDVVVIPATEGKLLPLDTFTRQGKSLLTMSPEFERVFCAYATDHQQARLVLTPKVQELLIAIRHRLGRDLRARFRGNSLVLACASTRDRFQQDHLGPNWDINPQRVATELQEVLALVDQVSSVMDLETR